MALSAITPVTALPTDPPGHANLAGKTFRADLGNAVEASARATAGTGTLYLACWRPEVSKWVPWGADSTAGGVAIDNTKRGGWAHGIWQCAWNRGADFCLVAEGGPTIAEAWIGGLSTGRG